MTNPEELEPDWATNRPPAEAFQIVRDAVENPKVAEKVEQLEEARILSMTHGPKTPKFKVLEKPEPTQSHPRQKDTTPWWKKL